VAPAGVFLCLAAEPVLGLVYGGAYVAAASLTSALVLAAAFQALGVIVWSTLVGAGRTWAGFAVQAGGQVAVIALTLLLVPAYGLAGVGVAVLVASLVTGTVGLAVLRAQLGVEVGAVRGLLTVAAAAWLAALVFWAAGATGWLQAAILAAAVVLVQARQLTGAERRWIRERLGWSSPEVTR
jgi:O-antigen/teichoic acid export membrane protein